MILTEPSQPNTLFGFHRSAGTSARCGATRSPGDATELGSGGPAKGLIFPCVHSAAQYALNCDEVAVQAMIPTGAEWGEDWGWLGRRCRGGWLRVPSESPLWGVSHRGDGFVRAYGGTWYRSGIWGRSCGPHVSESDCDAAMMCQRLRGIGGRLHPILQSAVTCSAISRMNKVVHWSLVSMMLTG